MRLTLTFPITALSCIVLSACFTSEAPLITVDQAVFPYERIVITEQAEETTLLRTAMAYVPEGGEQVEFLFQPVRDDVFVVQSKGVSGRGAELLYAVIKVDLQAGTASMYKAIAEETDANPEAGLVWRPDEGIRLETLEPLIKLGLAAIDAGETPATVYQLKVE